MPIKVLNTACILLIIFIATAMLCCFIALAEKSKQQKTINQFTYEVELGNWLGHRTYHCDRFEKDGNTYTLFDKQDTVTDVITVTEGWNIRIHKQSQ